MGDNPIALSRHGPIGYIPTTGWRAHLSCGIFGAEFESLIEQKNPCVRSQLARLSYRAGSASNYGVNVEITAENVGYLYPPAFRVLMEQARMHDEEQGQGNTINDIVPEQHHPIRHATVYQKRFEWLIGIKNRLFGIYCTSAVEVDSQEQPTYVVLGIFARGYSDPMERIVFVDKPKQLFRNLRWTAFRLRGLRGTVLSLKHVKGFMLYKVCTCYQPDCNPVLTDNIVRCRHRNTRTHSSRPKWKQRLAASYVYVQKLACSGLYRLRLGGLDSPRAEQQLT